MAHDLVIRGGNVADGRGSPLIEADIAIDDGKITEIGAVASSGTEEIDARGLLVAPGFVDIHSHYDGQAIWDDRLHSSSWHGITTTVMGNCGVGFAPVRPEHRDLLIEVMEGVEDIPAAVLREGLDWDWNSFPDFLDALEKRPHDMDICAQLPHSALRVYVMGERAMRREKATADDIAEMRRLAKEAMEAGALGFTTSRTANHRTLAGELIPSHGATPEEFAGIARGLTDAGKGVLQMIADLPPETRREEFAIMRRMVEESGRPLSLTVLQRNRDPDGWREVMAMVEDAVNDGHVIHAQVTPRPLGTMFGLDMERHPFCFHPSFQKIAHAPLAEKLAAWRDPAFRARLLSEEPLMDDPARLRRIQVFDYMFELGDPPDYTPPADRAISALARAEGRTSWEVAYDLMEQYDGQNMLYAPDTGYSGYSMDGCRDLLENPHTVVGLSDGGAHVGHISDISFSTFLLTYWGRDRPEGPLDVSWLIKRMTGDTADMVGLCDRGVIAPGYKADLNVIDLDRLSIGRPYTVHDLPMGAKRLLQKAEGYVATIVAGQPVYRDGDATGALPGRLVRGAQARPAA